MKNEPIEVILYRHKIDTKYAEKVNDYIEEYTDRNIQTLNGMRRILETVDFESVQYLLSL